MRLEKRLQRLEKSVRASSPQDDAMNAFLELAGAFNWNRDEPQGPRVVGVAHTSAQIVVRTILVGRILTAGIGTLHRIVKDVAIEIDVLLLIELFCSSISMKGTLRHDFYNTPKPAGVMNNDVQVTPADGSHHVPNPWPWPLRWA